MTVLKARAGERVALGRSGSPPPSARRAGVTVGGGRAARREQQGRGMRPAARARACRRTSKVTSSRIAERSRLSRLSMRGQSPAWQRALRSGSRGSARAHADSCPRSSTASRSSTCICAASCASGSRPATGGAHSRRASSHQSCSGGRWWCRTSPTSRRRSRLRMRSRPARSRAWSSATARRSWRCTTRFGRLGPLASCAIRSR